MSVVQSYYDRSMAEHWHGVFDGTDIGRGPTEDRSRYVVLRFNLSAFDNTLETLRERFEMYCGMIVRDAVEWNSDLFPEDAARRILSPPTIDGDKVAHAFMAAHFGMVGQFVIHSERELNKGYADVAYGYVIELKYLKRGEPADEGVVSDRLEEDGSLAHAHAITVKTWP